MGHRFRSGLHKALIKVVTTGLSSLQETWGGKFPFLNWFEWPAWLPLVVTICMTEGPGPGFTSYWPLAGGLLQVLEAVHCFLCLLAFLSVSLQHGCLLLQGQQKQLSMCTRKTKPYISLVTYHKLSILKFRLIPLVISKLQVPSISKGEG